MKLIFATTNKAKILRANNALIGTGLELILPQIKLDDVFEIQSDSQEEVAIDKAKKYYEILHTPLIVTDSGLFIQELNGFPGVYTKYVLDTLGIERALMMLNGIERPRAFTQRTVVYYDGEIIEKFVSVVEGEITFVPRGGNGSGYDKYFIVSNKNKTIAELTDVEQASMVGDVWQQLAQWSNDKLG